MKALDMSVFGGSVGPNTWAAMRQEGWELAIIGSWHGSRQNPYTQENLEKARRAGMKTATYAALNGRASGQFHIRQARAACGYEWGKLLFVAIDCEVDGIIEGTIEGAIERVRELGQVPIIYTAHWWWHDHFQNRKGFQHLPLWNAFYDGDPDYDFASLPYGGWTPDKLVGEQYQGTTTVQGVSVDLNNFKDEWVREMEEVQNLRNQVTWLKTALDKVAGERDVAKAYLDELARRRREHLKIEGIEG